MAGRSARAGLILLEAALALTIFAVSAAVILMVLNHGVAAQKAASDRQLVVDLARTAMALIESGARSPESLNGPIAAWPTAGAALSVGSAAMSTGGAGYELAVQTQPWGADGLVLVSLEARRGGGDGARYVLRQLVSMTDRAQGDGGGP